MVTRDMEAVTKEKHDNQKKRQERNLAANFNLENFQKQTMLKKLEREAEKRAYSLKRDVFNSTNAFETDKRSNLSDSPAQ